MLNVQKHFPGQNHSAHVWRKKIAGRNWHEYPEIAAVPTIYEDLRLISQPGDIIIAPDVRVEQCNPWMASRGVTSFQYILSVNFLPALARSASRDRLHCRFLHHSYKLSNYSSHGGVAAVPRSLIIRPYISPSIVAFCARTRANRTRHADSASRFTPPLHEPSRAVSPTDLSSLASHTRSHAPIPHAPHLPLVLVDNDAKGAVRYHVSKACNQSRCEAIVVNRKSRGEVLRLLARASVVVDWCMVGTERLPVEAVLCGAVLLTSNCREGGASDVRDFPIARRNLLRDPAELTEAIARVVANLQYERESQAEMVALYHGGTSPATMEEEVRAAVETIVDRSGGGIPGLHAAPLSCGTLSPERLLYARGCIPLS